MRSAGAAAAGFGAFRVLEPVETSGIVFKVAVGDLNRDGIRDLAAANFQGAPAEDVIVQLGKPNGTFKAPDYHDVGVDADGIAIGKLNDDKRPDLAVASLSENVVRILEGAPGGGFDEGPTLEVGAGPGYIAPSDLDKDGRIDLVVANYYGGTDAISVLLRDDSEDGWADDVGYDAAGGSAGFALARVNSDKRPDVVTQTDGAPNIGTVSVLLGNADGTFDAAEDTPLPGVASYDNVAVADLNGDKDPDVVTGLYTPSELDVLLGNGDGTFADPVTTPLPGVGPQGIAASDFDRDGKADVAIGAYDLNELHVMRGKGDGTVRANPVTYPVADLTEAVVDRNIDANRSRDLIVGTDSSLEVFLNKAR